MSNTLNNKVTLSLDEANGILNTLRTTQMNLQLLINAVPADRCADLLLASPEYAGALNEAVDRIEAAIFEAGVVEITGPEWPEPGEN